MCICHISVYVRLLACGRASACPRLFYVYMSYICIHVYVYVCLYVCLCVCVSVCMYIRTYTYGRAWVGVGVRSNRHDGMYLYMSNVSTHTYVGVGVRSNRHDGMYLYMSKA